MRSDRFSQPRERRRGRPAISGIVAALILFVMLFTVGTGYFLWVSDNNQVYSQALVDRNNSNQAQQSESLSLTPSVPGGDIWVSARNTGGVPIVIASIMVTDLSGTLQSPICTATISAACGQGINPGAPTPAIDTRAPFSPGTSVIVKVLTQRGSVFSAVYLSPTLSTTLSATSIPAGGSAFDTAKLTGASGTASGTVTYYFSPTTTCTTGPTTKVGQPVSVVSGNVPNSANQQFSALGTFYWYAFYSGDTNDASATSPCEPMTVGAATGVTISTQLSSQVVNTGQPVYDTAALFGATSNAGGTVTYEYFSGSSCLGTATPVGSPVTVTNGLVPNSAPVSYVVAGSYSWNAIYSGDANNNNNTPVTSACEPLTVVVNNGGGGSTGSLTQVIGSFKFYFTNCNPVAGGGSCGVGNGNGLGDGVNARGYYGYGLSFFGGTDCDSQSAPCVPDVFQITLTNQDPQGRSISLSPQSFLLLSGVCLSESVCGGEGDFGVTFSQGYWIVDGICSPASTCTGLGAVPTPYSSTVTVGSGATVTLYFYCSGPCTSSASLAASRSNNPAPGTYLSASLNLYGLYSDGTPFGQDIPFISSYVSPVQIIGCATGSTFPGPSCWSTFNPAEQLSGSPGSQITLSVNGFAAQPTNPFSISVYWVNPSGTTSVVNTATTCDVNNQPCHVTFTIPAGAGTGSYGLYVTSDGVNNAYATVAVLGPTQASTSLSQTSIPVGGSVFDSATLSGVTVNAGGQVTYQFFAGSACQGSATTVSTVTVNNGIVPNSASHTFNSAGSYSWNAAYTGDGNNNGATSACEPMTVQVASPTVSTTLSKPTVAAGQTVSDSAALTGASANAGGTVTYEYFPNNSCTGSASIVATVTVTNGNVPPSGNFSPNSVGTLYFVASYSGDSNNNPATSGCGAEPLAVTLGTPTINTNLIPGNTVPVGTSASDSATLTGASSIAGGTVTYTYFTGSACSAGSMTVSTVTVTNGNVPNSASIPFNTVGSYSWRAAYSGDANDNPATSACEPLTVTKASPTITTTVSSSGTITIGGSATDQAVFANGFGTLTGTLVLTAYSDSSCATVAFTSSTITVNGNGPYTSNSFTPTSAGTYYWKATFTDTDGNNNNVVTTCGSGGPASERLTVNKVSPTISTSLSATTITSGSSVFDRATLTGATGTAGGTVQYEYFNGGSCSGAANNVGAAVTVTNGLVPNSVSHTFNLAGSYSWNAVYSGDTNNNGATSPCEPLTVVKGSMLLIQQSAPCTTITSGTQTCSITMTVSQGDELVVAAGTLRIGSTNCRTVAGGSISDSFGDPFTSVGGSAQGSNSGNGGECAASEIFYAPISTGGSDTITVTVSGGSPPASGVVVVYELRNAAFPPTVSSSNTCSGSCSTTLSTSSFSTTAGSFLVTAGSVCTSSSNVARTITAGPPGFTTSYATPGQVQYVGYNIPGASGSTTFSMTSSGASGTPECWSDLGAQFLDPPPQPSANPVHASSPSPSFLTAQFLQTLPLGVWAEVFGLYIALLWMAFASIVLSTRMNMNYPRNETT